MARKNIADILVETAPLAIFQHRYLFRTSAAGQVADGMGKDGETKFRSYPAGAFVLTDASMNILAGPVSAQAASVLALEIIDGNARAATMPGVAMRLAIAVLGMTLNPIPPKADEAALDAADQPQHEDTHHG
jgi:hypothetical protein